MLEIKNKIEFESNLWVGLVASSQANTSQEERIKFVTDIASITMSRLGMKTRPISVFDGALKGNTIEQAEDLARQRLYNRLLKESAGKPSTPFEFIPVRIRLDNIVFHKSYAIEAIGVISIKEWFVNEILKYSYLQVINNKEYLLTNMRCLLNAGIKEEDIPFNTPEEVEGFKVVAARIPKTAFDHLVTHGEVRRIAESSRNKKYLNEVEFHYPSEWSLSYTNAEKLRDKQLLNSSIEIVKDKFIKAEDATKELSCRRLMLCAFKAWQQDPNSWDNLFNLRIDSKAQSITQLVVENIKKLIK